MCIFEQWDNSVPEACTLLSLNAYLYLAQLKHFCALHCKCAQADNGVLALLLQCDMFPPGNIERAAHRWWVACSVCKFWVNLRGGLLHVTHEVPIHAICCNLLREAR